VSYSSYRDYYNYYHVVGEVQNTGDVPVKDVFVSITLYDAGGGVLESSDEEILLDTLLVGRKAPFTYTASEENSPYVSSYDVSVSSFESSSDKPLGLLILSSNFTDAGYVIIVRTVMGDIKNVGSGLALAVKVVATFYNGPGGTGSVVGVSAGVSIPVNLNPQAVGSFTIIQDITGREALFVSYILTAESLEYALVPEFPSSMIPLVFVVITLAASVLAKRKI